MKRLEADVVVIGAGTAGLPAAVSAAEGGARVILLEKRGLTGGTGNRANAILGIQSRIQKEKGETLTPEQAYYMHMEWVHWRVDARLVSEFYKNAGSTIDWLIDEGIEFVGFQGMKSPLTAHVVKGVPPGPKQLGQAAEAMKILTRRAKQLGVQLFLKTPAKKILKRGGRIVGVIAEDENGEELRIKAGAVIIATGGFAANPDMMDKYTGYREGRDMYVLHKAGLEGDGIRMAWEVGAASTEMYMGLTCHLPPPCNGPGGTLAEFSAFRQPQNLLVNLQGQRFISESIGTFHRGMANAIALQKDRAAFMVFDGAMKKYYDTINMNLGGPTGHAGMYRVFKNDNLDDNIREAREKGYKWVYMADTLEELCQQTGINFEGLKKTIEEYNRFCEAGRDDVFYKDPKTLMPFKGEPKFYAARFFLGAYNSVGGIKINYKTEVLTPDFEVIPGLYATGVDANSMYTHTYAPLAGNYMGFAVTSGRMAALNALEYLKSLKPG